MFSQINNNLANINMSVNSDGKLVFTDKDGADTVLNFSGGEVVFVASNSSNTSSWYVKAHTDYFDTNYTYGSSAYNIAVKKDCSVVVLKMYSNSGTFKVNGSMPVFYETFPDTDASYMTYGSAPVGILKLKKGDIINLTTGGKYWDGITFIKCKYDAKKIVFLGKLTS